MIYVMKDDQGRSLMQTSKISQLINYIKTQNLTWAEIRLEVNDYDYRNSWNHRKVVRRMLIKKSEL